MFEWMCDMAKGNPQILKKREMVCDECITKDGMEIMMMMNIVFVPKATRKFKKKSMVWECDECM